MLMLIKLLRRPASPASSSKQQCQQEPKDARCTCLQVKERVCGFAVAHPNDGVRLNAVKFLELSCILLSADVPRGHALLQPGMVGSSHACPSEQQYSGMPGMHSRCQESCRNLTGGIGSRHVWQALAKKMSPSEQALSSLTISLDNQIRDILQA